MKNSKYMLKAIKLAKKGWGKTSPNPLVGAIIVKDNKIIGKGYHHKAGEAHAEVNAINDAGKNAKSATIYVTLEPCSTYGRTPPCTNAIIAAGISKVVIGSTDPNPEHAGQGIKILEDAGIEVIIDIEKEKCLKLNEAFFKWITKKMPFVILKMAMTLDGKIATESGQSQWITGETARNRVQELRQWSDAIMVGGETVRKDSPSLTVRNPQNWKNQPRRIIISKSLQQKEVNKLMIKTAQMPEIISISNNSDFENNLKRLGKENITSILIEGGGEIASLAISAGIVDKVEFHIAPKILGGKNSRPVVGGANPLSLAESYNLKNISVEMLGDDISVSGYLK